MKGGRKEEGRKEGRREVRWLQRLCKRRFGSKENYIWPHMIKVQ